MQRRRVYVVHMKLLSGPLSPFTEKVRIALAEKNIACECIDVPFGPAGYEPRHPEVVRINPKGQVPVLIDGDVEIYDSTVILEYLEEQHPDPPLFPVAAAARARLDRRPDRVRRPEHTRRAIERDQPRLRRSPGRSVAEHPRERGA